MKIKDPKEMRTPTHEDECRIVPTLDRVLVRRDSADEVSAGGIHIPQIAQRPVKSGLVIKLGKGPRRSDTGETVAQEIAFQVKAGDRILFAEFAGTNVTCDGKEYFLMAEPDILAIVEPKKGEDHGITS